MLIGILPTVTRLRRGLDRNKPRDPAVRFCLSVKIAPAVVPSIAAVSTAGDVCSWATAPPTDDQGCDKNQGQDRSRKVVLLFNSVILLRSLSLSSESVVGEKLRHLFSKTPAFWKSGRVSHCGWPDKPLSLIQAVEDFTELREIIALRFRRIFRRHN